MKNFLLVAVVAMKSEKLFFSFSMETIVRETNSFFNIMQLTNQNYSWKNGVKQIKSTQETLREKCPSTEFFLVRIFPYSD